MSIKSFSQSGQIPLLFTKVLYQVQIMISYQIKGVEPYYSQPLSSKLFVLEGICVHSSSQQSKDKKWDIYLKYVILAL